MTEHRVVARDMRAALKTVRARYGEDALILDVRTLRRPERGSLRLREEVELHVVVPGPGGEELPPRLAPVSLESEVERLEALLAEVEEQLDAAETPGHPLASVLTSLGLSPGTLARLARDHAAEVPPVDQAEEEPALARIAAQLPCVEAMQLDDLRGHHALLGAPGVGRSTLAMKLCAGAAAGGRRAVHLSLAPAHPGERLRLEAEAETHGHEAVLAPDGAALMDALRYLRGRDLLVLDLPAFVPEQQALLERAELELGRGPVLRHAVLPADGRAALPPKLAASAQYLALVRGDLEDPLRLAVELGSGSQQPLSFLSAGAEASAPLGLASPEALLEGLRARLGGVRGAGVGAGR